MITIACVFVLATAASAVPLEHDPGSRCPPDVRSLENKCGLHALIDVMYASDSQSPPVNTHNLVQGMANHFRRRRNAGSDDDMNTHVELFCKKYDAFDRCLTTGYQIPELCLESDALQIHLTLSFLCGPGKQGLADHLPCMSSVQHVECPTYAAASYSSIGGILSALNRPMNDTGVLSGVHRYWQIFCHPSLYKACMEKTYRIPCGEQAVRFMADYMDFILRETNELYRARGNEALSKAFSCDNTTSLTQLEDASSDPDNKPTGGPGIGSMISQAQSMSGQCIQMISNIMPSLIDTFGRCGEATQIAQIALCACKTLQKFHTGNFSEEAYSDVLNRFCMGAADQYMKCTAVFESTCTDGVLSHTRRAVSSTCSGFASAVENLKCWEQIPDFFGYKGNCSVAWMSLNQLIVHASSPPVERQQYMAKVSSDARCLIREQIGNLKTHAVSLCGESIANDFITSWQMFDLLLSDVEQFHKSLLPPNYTEL